MKSTVSELGRGEALSVEWRETDAGFGTTARTVIEQARSSDLVVISQRDAEWGQSSLFEDPERIAIECGRPVLLIPNHGAVKTPPQRVLISWNGSRESARAAFDATSVLKPGTDVTVAWFDPPPGVAGAAVGAELCTALARHGLTCEATEVRTTDGNVGAAIRREAAARGVDLIVMGAYGHSRLREFVLGGASRDIFANMDRPVLMSH
jgi:nucleotide-binding universal stress UspA family protein